MTTEQAPSAQRSVPDRGRVFVSPVGSRRVEVTLAVAMSVFGVLFSFQSVPALVAQWSYTGTPIGVTVLLLVFGSIAVAGLAAVLRQWTRPIFLTAAVAYLLALALWPSVVPPHDMLVHGETPWIVQVATVPAGFVIVARRRWGVPALYALLVAVSIGVLRSSPAGGDVDALRATLDAVYAFALDIVLLVLTVAVRLAAASVDQAQNNALQRYAAAQTDLAMESERVATDALVHDSVLTTFLSAAAATTPDATALAATMARKAMSNLTRATVAAGTGPRVPLSGLLARIRDEAAVVADRFTFASDDTAGVELPTDVADALAAAAAQAMMNSVKHAGGEEVPRSVVVRGLGDGALRVEVADTGRGFDPAAIGSQRLGVRVSIVERARHAGAEVEIDTAPGAGTRVVLSWPAAARAVAERADQTAVAR